MPRKPSPTKGRANKASSRPKRPPKRTRSKKPAVTSAVQRPRSWRAFWIGEGLTVLTGITLGGMLAGGWLWWRALGDVDAYLASPPRAVPGKVLSAPLRIEAGAPYTVPELSADLLAAGYERVDRIDGADQFVVSRGRFDIATDAPEWPGLALTEGRSVVVLGGDAVASTTPEAGVTLAPVTLAVLGDLDSRRTEVRLDALSPWVESAVLAMEDTRFREHGGVDPLGVARAVWHNLTSRGRAHGGSTLTQQLAKNLFLTQERTLQRKVREAFFAAALESRLTKDELLSLYLGEVYLGQVGGVPLHGVEQAARAWYGVSAERLTLGQAAVIAGVISAPNRYAPTRHPEAASERRQVVLDRMASLGWITETEQAAALAEPVVGAGDRPGLGHRAPWAVDAALDQVAAELGEAVVAGGGHVVLLTVQPHLQRRAQQAVSRSLTELTSRRASAAEAEAALVALDPSTSDVLALVGGRDHRRSAFHRAIYARRQAGSTIKPFTTLLAFDAHDELTPLTVLTDEPRTLTVDGTTWTPRNYDGQFLGEVSLRQMLEQSRNLPAIDLADRHLGFDALAEGLRRLGLDAARPRPSLALGAVEVSPWQLAAAYTAFQNGGVWRPPRLVQRVLAPSGRTVWAPTTEPVRVADAASAALTVKLLEGVVERGTGRRARALGVEGAAAGKTGTTDGGRDAWFAGFTPRVTAVAWVGHDRGGAGLSGGADALPVWAHFVRDTGLTGATFGLDGALETGEVCLATGQLACPDCEDVEVEWFRPGSLPDRSCGPLVGIADAFRSLFGADPEAREARRRRREERRAARQGLRPEAPPQP